ncbi:MAG: kelch repeat-containing protein [Myxococcota bacterium]
MFARWGWVVVALAGAGCTEGDGSFTLTLDWADDPPVAGSVDLYALVTSPDGQTVSAEPAAYSPGVTLNFVRVPYGSGLIVEVRALTAGAPEDSSPRYFGRSEPFDFSAGDALTVPVALTLQDAPGAAGDTPEGSATVLNAVDGRVATSALELEVRARGASLIEVAQDFLFVQGLVSFDATTAAVGPADSDGAQTFRVSYDLNATIDRCRDAVGDALILCDGLRQVSVRAVRDLGDSRLEGDPEIVAVTLDTQPPRATGGSVQLTGSINNVLARVQTATGAGDPGSTQVFVTVTLDEPVDAMNAPPSLVASNGSSTMNFSALSVADRSTAVEFSALVNASVHGDGTYTPTLSVSDAVGNRSTLDLAELTFVVDSTADTLVIDQGAVSYTRAAVGNAATETLANGAFVLPAGPRYFALGPPDGLDSGESLPATAFALGSGDIAAIRVFSDANRSILMGVVQPSADGVWNRADLQLQNVDAPQVFVTGIDDAGNESEPVLVERAWYIASAASIAPARTPHGADYVPLGGPPLTTRRDELPSRDSVGGLDGLSADTGAQQFWERPQARTGISPSKRTRHASVYDSARDRVVVFGGRADGAGLSDLWEFDGDAWVQFVPPPGTEVPPVRDETAMAYDAARGVVVLFGGIASDELNDTWEYDGIQWRRGVPPGSDQVLPPGRHGHQMVYDAARGRVVLVGGTESIEGGRFSNDTWEWDGQSWSNVTPVSFPERAPDRYAFQMAYDAARERTVLFDCTSECDTGSPTSVWEWDGTRWAEISAQGASPTLDQAYAAAYDATNGWITVVGRIDGSAGMETWSWDGERWQRLTPVSLNLPGRRVEHSLVWDSARMRSVLFGGDGRLGSSGASDELADTWGWNGSSWIRLTPTPLSPGSGLTRSDAAMAYNPDNDEIVVFGGDTGSDSLPQADTCVWTDRWSCSEESGPDPRFYHGMIYDETLNRFVMFGGTTDSIDCTSQTWVRIGGGWAGLSSFFTAPSARCFHAMAYDVTRSRTVLFGGSPLFGDPFGDTWLWSGAGAWVQANPATQPPARAQSAMAFDRGREVTVLFGGEGEDGLLADTWEWDGTNWTDVSPSVAVAQPSARHSHAMAYDAVREKVVLHGGGGADAWEWDGTVWREITAQLSVGRPSSRSGHTMAFDANDGVMVMQGGFADGGFTNETWLSRSAGTASLRFTVVLPPELQPTRPLESARYVRDLRVRASCGGRFTQSGTPDTGATLFAWRWYEPGQVPGSWAALGSNASGVEAPTMIEYRPAEEVRSSEPARFVFARERLYFECRPADYGNGPPAEVSMDYIEARLSYDARCLNGFDTSQCPE